MPGNTVRSHLKIIYKKLHILSRMEVIEMVEARKSPPPVFGDGGPLAPG